MFGPLSLYATKHGFCERGTCDHMTGRNCLNGSGIEKIKWNLESVLEKSNNPVGKNSGNLVVFATLNYSPGHC